MGKLGDDFHQELLLNILVITQGEEAYYDGGNMYMGTGYLLVSFGSRNSLMLAKDAASLCLSIQQGLPTLGLDACTKMDKGNLLEF